MSNTLTCRQSQDRIVSVWLTGQNSVAAQLLQGGYASGTESDFGLMPPAIAAHAINAYTRPGQLVLDPDCGAGTVVAEAVRAGRSAIGLASRVWLRRLAQMNLIAARNSALRTGSRIVPGGLPTLTALSAIGLVGKMDLLLTTMRDERRPEYRTVEQRIAAAVNRLTRILRRSIPLLTEQAYVVVTVRPRHSNGALFDVASRIILAGRTVGLIPLARYVALTAGLHKSQVLTRASFLTRQAATHTGGVPIVIPAHHDVIVFRLSPLPEAQHCWCAASPDSCSQLKVMGRAA